MGCLFHPTIMEIAVPVVIKRYDTSARIVAEAGCGAEGVKDGTLCFRCRSIQRGVWLGPFVFALAARLGCKVFGSSTVATGCAIGRAAILPGSGRGAFAMAGFVVVRA